MICWPHRLPLGLDPTDISDRSLCALLALAGEALGEPDASTSWRRKEQGEEMAAARWRLQPALRTVRREEHEELLWLPQLCSAAGGLARGEHRAEPRGASSMTANHKGVIQRLSRNGRV